jgi:hypothetical protein
MASQFNSVVMIGTQRSGSNLLRLMLNQIPTLAAPHPPHILQRLMPLLPIYGDLANSDRFKQLVDDVCQLVELNPVPWENVILDRNNIFDRCRENSLVAVFSVVYDTLAQAWGADTWCCKSLANVHYVPQISSYLPDCKYIYIYRDGRDVAVSFKKAVVGQKHFYHIAQEWAKDQRAALRVRERLSSKQVLSLSYESLTQDTEMSLQNLCQFLEVEYDPAMLNFYESKEAASTASASSLWVNVSKPVMSGNSRKFLTQAPAEEVKIFELVAGDVLDTLGYERVFTAKGEFATFSPEEIQQFTDENQEMKLHMQETMDGEDKERRERQLALLDVIRSRTQVMSA